MYQAIIFDLDGVLCSTDRYHYQAWKQLADRLGISFDESVNARLRGVSRMESLDIILEKSDKVYTKAEKETLAAEKNAAYCKLLQQMNPTDLSPEVCETLAKLRQRGIRLAVGSSSKNTKTILERIGLGNFFDAVSDGTNITHSKPDPEVFLLAAKMLGLSPLSCLVVEDASAGVEAAIRGHFDCAGLGDAAQHSRVTYPLKRFQDILAIVDTEKL